MSTSLTDGDKRRLFAFPEKSVLLCFFLSLSHKLCTQLLDGWSHFFLNNSISENFQTYTTLSSPSNLFELHAMRALIYNPYYATYFWRHIDIWRLECHDFRLIYVNFRTEKRYHSTGEGWNPEWAFFSLVFFSLFFWRFFFSRFILQNILVLRAGSFNRIFFPTIDIEYVSFPFSLLEFLK